jgi:hypothetical protein
MIIKFDLVLLLTVNKMNIERTVKRKNKSEKINV